MSIESLNAFSMDFFSLKGKTAIVTGGNSGLGQAFAMALAKAVPKKCWPFGGISIPVSSEL